MSPHFENKKTAELVPGSYHIPDGFDAQRIHLEMEDYVDFTGRTVVELPDHMGRVCSALPNEYSPSI